MILFSNQPQGTRWRQIKFPGCFVLFLMVSILPITIADAFEHDHSAVEFQEYSPDVVKKNRQHNKPYLLLFSAQWCHWCAEFAEETLTKKKVYTYLNTHFTNIFVDADIHTAAYRKYKATGVPYTVFLNPDGSVYYRYAGTLYADDFLEVIQDIRKSVGAGRSVYEEEPVPREYSPPVKLARADLKTMRDRFHEGVLDSFDAKEHGVGKGEKSVLPRTFLYLLHSTEGESRKEAIRRIEKTLRKAIDHIYDPVEGGFFRYAETSDWRIPHYEKMADLNAGVVLLLYKVAREIPSTELKKAADKTMRYLTSTLFEPNIGSFLSFQEADTSYYFLTSDRRKQVERPPVVEKIFTDRLAGTLSYLIDTLDYTSGYSLEEQIIRSLDFLAEPILGGDEIYQYYSLPNKQWSGASNLTNHALVARLYLKAAARFQSDRYQDVASRILQVSMARFYDKEKQIFIDPSMDDTDDVEYLMEMNGLFAQTMMGLEKTSGSNYLAIVKPLITYFSGMDQRLEDRIWDSKDWQFTERYVPYLKAADKYLAAMLRSQQAKLGHIVYVE